MLDIRKTRQLAALTLVCGLLFVLAVLSIGPSGEARRPWQDLSLCSPAVDDVPGIKIFRRRTCSGGRCG